MTLLVPLNQDLPLPSSPPFLVHPHDVQLHLRNALRAILKARRLVVVCGAGISVQAGIPDFRSPTGLFQTLKRDNPKDGLTSGKDLFDASVFNSEHTTSLFCQMIAQLSGLSQAASPTPFHQLLRVLDDRGRLLRVYTQNIDGIESKSGLSFGIPEFEDKRYKPRSRAKASPATGPADPTASTPSQPSGSQPNSRLPSPTIEVPRCIPLHGTLQTLHCQTCTHTFPLEHHIEALTSGTPPYCPECTQMEETRQLVGKRARGVGKLRPSVVLYNELHKDGEGVGEVVRRDLVGGSKGKGRSGADVLLVVGTSLRVPGTKRIVREFSKAVRSRGSCSSKELPHATPTCTPLRSPSLRQASEDDTPPMKSIYLNLDFPVPTREWEGVFDTWVQGDAQSFAHILMDEIAKEAAAKEAVLERKRKREEEAALGEPIETLDQAPPAKKRKTTSQCTGKPPSSRKRTPSDRPRSAPRKPRSVEKSTQPTLSKAPTGTALKPISTDKLYIRIPCLIPKVVIPAHPPSRVRNGSQSFPVTPSTTQHKHKMRSLAGSKHDNEHYPPSDNTDNNSMNDSDLSDECSDVEAPDELPVTVMIS